MKKILIYGFKSKNQYRMKFVNFLKSINNIKLKEAKTLQDLMIDGVPIELYVNENKVEDCKKILDNLEMNYLIE